MQSSYRLAAIYWALISTTGTFNISTNLPDGTDVTQSFMSAYTLNNVNVNGTILTAGTDSQGGSPEPLTINNVPSGGAFAAANYLYSNPSGTQTITVSPATGTTSNILSRGDLASSSVGQGYFTNLDAGTNTFTASTSLGNENSNKSPFVVAVFAPAQAPGGFVWSGTVSNSWTR